MKKEELEYNIKTYVYNLIDCIFVTDNIFGKMKNATAKYWADQNQWKLDEIISAFVDKDGCIDENGLLNHFEKVIFEDGDFRVSVREIMPERMKSVFPDKIIVFKKEDLYNIIGRRKLID